MIKLNVLLVSYNASPYIKQCVESIVRQRTSFHFNVIVADDYSTDDTVHKIKALADDSFIFLESNKNLGLKGNYKRGFAACTAQYIAVMEGDDFWTDPRRLQKHVDFLDNHPECAMTSNNRILANYHTGDFKAAFASTQAPYIYVNGIDTLTKFYGVNFSTCVYKKHVIDKLPSNWFDITGAEVALNVMCLQYGLMGFFPDFMTVHRMHEESLIAQLGRLNHAVLIKETAEIMKTHTGKKYEIEYDRIINEMDRRIYGG